MKKKKVKSLVIISILVDLSVIIVNAMCCFYTAHVAATVCCKFAKRIAKSIRVLFSK